MKKFLLGAAILASGVVAHAQNGLENVIIEKYYVSNAADSIGSVGILPVGSVTYRIYADLLPGYKFQALYGVPGHSLVLNTTTSFFNNEDRGAKEPNGISVTNTRKNTVMLDSWFSAGATATGKVGVIKSEDNDGALSNTNGLLQNNAASAGIPLTVADGMITGTPEAVSFVGLTTELDVFDAISQAGNSFVTSNGSIASLNGSVGGFPSTNRVLIGQFTTNGLFHYELNIQIGTPTGGTEKYVAQNPTGAEISIASLMGTVGAPNVLPTVAITAPANNANVITGDVVAISANAADADGTVAQVQFFVNGVSVGTDNSAPYSVNWNSTSGTKAITAVATDNEGGSKTSTTVNIVVAANQAPSVSVSAPSNAVVGDVVALNATASDVDGTVTAVDFFVNNILVGTDSVAPYQVNWTAVLGANSVKAKATDDRGLQSTSTATNVIVGNNVPPTVSLTSPSNGFSTTAPAVVNLTANAADGDGSVTQVEFFVNGVSVNVDATAPYAFAWTSVIGNATIVAKATDNKGALTSSTPVSIVVADPNALPYKIAGLAETCLPTSFCLPVVANDSIDNVIGYDVVLNYNKSKVTPTGVITVDNDLINPSYVDVANIIDTVAQTVTVSLYFNGTAPANTEFHGLGNIFCVEFNKNAGFTSVDTASFSVASLQESYITGVSTKLADPGTYTTYKDTTFTASIKFWNGGAIKYNAASPTDFLITNVYGTDNSCGNRSGAAVQPDMDGRFEYVTSNGVNVSIEKDILGTTDVQAIINGADAVLARKILFSDASFSPSAYQIISSDANMDGVISAGDISQINQRAVLMISEFRQAWNYDVNGVSNGALSKDWLFLDSMTVVNNAAYHISSTYPANDGLGFSKSHVPVVSFCSTVPVADPNGCPIIDTAVFKAIMVGDVNGNYKDVAPTNAIIVNTPGKVTFDLSNAAVQNGFIDIPVLVSSLNPVNALDFALKSNMVFASVTGQQSDMQALGNYNELDETVRVTSNSLLNFNMGTAALTVRFFGTSITQDDLNEIVGYVNGERAETEVLTGVGILNRNNSQSVVYPNPAKGLVNVLVTEDAKVTLINADGKEVTMPVQAYANQKLSINTENLAAGIYTMKITGENFAGTKKVVIEK